MTEIVRARLLRLVGDPFDEDDVLRFDEDGAVAVAGGRIVDVGPADAVRAAHPDAAERLAPQHVIAPAFVDAHVHYPQIGIIASHGATLLDWLQTYTFPEEARFTDAEHAADAARAFFDETLRNGVATTCAFCTSHPTSVDAYFAEAERRGLRALGGKVAMDRGAPDALTDTPKRAYDEGRALSERWGGRGRLGYVVTPRFAITSTPEQLEACGALWAEVGGLMQTHLSETRPEIAETARLYPDEADYLAVYERFGLVGPGAVFGHGVHLSVGEAARLAEAGASVAHCPTSNQFLGSGACAVETLHRRGVRVGVATDTGGGTSFSPFDTMKSAYEQAMGRGVSLTPAQLWWLATVGGARALRLEERVGALDVGMDADFVLLDPAATPLLARRTARAATPAELLFALIVLGDDRAVAETWSGGRRVWSREAGE